MNFDGVITAIPTPFLNQKIDFKSLENFLSWQLECGIEGFVVNGTTGESPTLEWEEVKEIFDFTKKIVKEKVPVIVGTGTNSTNQTCKKTKEAYDWGADAALVVVPYYNKPPQRGLFLHFKSVADAADIPVILYNVPTRTITSLDIHTILALAAIPNIVGIKEATGDLTFGKELLTKKPKDFFVSSGDDETYLPLALLGGQGVISVLSSILPKETVAWLKMARHGEKNVLEAFEPYKNLTKLLFSEANPIPVKQALYRMGYFSTNELRLPLISMSEEKSKLLETVMKQLELIG